MRLTDMFLSLPLIPLLLVMVMLFRDRPSAESLRPRTWHLHPDRLRHRRHQPGCTSPASCAGEVLALKEREFVLAARSIGTPPPDHPAPHPAQRGEPRSWSRRRWALPRRSSPNRCCPSWAWASRPTFPTWGRLLYDGLQYMQIYPERVIWPGLRSR
jgi:peptide/nickel transport system permease protein